MGNDRYSTFHIVGSQQMVAFNFFVSLFGVLRAEVEGGTILLSPTLPHGEMEIQNSFQRLQV